MFIAGHVQVTALTGKLIGSISKAFVFESRGEISIKAWNLRNKPETFNINVALSLQGKGLIETFWLSKKSLRSSEIIMELEETSNV